MQCSVLPHLEIYGDVKPNQVYRGLLPYSKEKLQKLLGSTDKSLQVVEPEKGSMLELQKSYTKAVLPSNYDPKANLALH